MPPVVVDTHALIWHLFDPNQLSSNADTAIQSAISTVGEFVFVSYISLVEIVYLVEKTRLPQKNFDHAKAAITDPATALVLADIDVSAIDSLQSIPRNVVPDMPDRIVAATAHAKNIPLVTRDAQIQQAPITTIW